MSQAQWTAIDEYITDQLVRSDPALDAAIEASDRAGLPAIQVAPNQGKLLHLLARTQGARSILEIGTLGGYSTIWLARALPKGGKVITLEIDPKHAEVARSNIARAQLSDTVEVRVGPALETLAAMVAEERGAFDLVFIDADKASTPQYFEWALKLTRPGSLIIVDNVVRHGAVIDAFSDDPNVKGIRRLNELLASEPRVIATAIQTVGSKGHDGLAFALVIA
jgi:predicted O-methyltransferase YrrM